MQCPDLDIAVSAVLCEVGEAMCRDTGRNHIVIREVQRFSGLGGTEREKLRGSSGGRGPVPFCSPAYGCTRPLTVKLPGLVCVCEGGCGSGLAHVHAVKAVGL